MLQGLNLPKPEGHKEGRHARSTATPPLLTQLLASPGARTHAVHAPKTARAPMPTIFMAVRLAALGSIIHKGAVPLPPSTGVCCTQNSCSLVLPKTGGSGPPSSAPSTENAASLGHEGNSAAGMEPVRCVLATRKAVRVLHAE